MDGLVLDESCFELLAGGERVGSRRTLTAADVELLASLSGRYVRAVQSDADPVVLLEIGRALYAWLDVGQFDAVIADDDHTPLVHLAIVGA